MKSQFRLASEIRIVNKEFRDKDESHLWPISGRFNVTERCIRRIQHLRQEGLEIEDRESYRALLDDMISQVVNSPHAIDEADRIKWRDLNM